jgi:hypothetical protein
VNDWRDKTIWTISQDEIESFDIIKQEEKMSLVKQDNIWKLIYEGGSITAKDSAVNDIINKVKNLSCANFEDTKSISDCGLNSPQKELIINLTDGITKKLIIGNEKEKNQFYAMTADTDEIYILYNWSVNFFDKKFEDFIQKE